MALVSEAMNRALVTVAPQASAAEALAIARRTGAEHVLVMDEHNLVGIVRACDLRGGRPDEPVAKRMKVHVPTVRPDAYVEDAAATLATSAAGCLPVALGGLILGTVSETEIARAGIRAPHPLRAELARREERLRN